MHFFLKFSAAIADRRPFSAAIGAAACRERSDRGAQFCAATDFNLRISCFELLLHWEWYLESTWGAEGAEAKIEKNIQLHYPRPPSIKK